MQKDENIWDASGQNFTGVSVINTSTGEEKDGLQLLREQPALGMMCMLYRDIVADISELPLKDLNLMLYDENSKSIFMETIRMSSENEAALAKARQEMAACAHDIGGIFFDTFNGALSFDDEYGFYAFIERCAKEFDSPPAWQRIDNTEAFHSMNCLEDEEEDYKNSWQSYAGRCLVDEWYFATLPEDVYCNKDHLLRAVYDHSQKSQPFTLADIRAVLNIEEPIDFIDAEEVDLSSGRETKFFTWH